MKNKRYCTIAEYQRQTGLSYQTIKNALDNGELRGIRTTGGFWKVDMQADTNPDTAALLQKIDEQSKLLSNLCRHLGIVV
jgi:hypothetical protein